MYITLAYVIIYINLYFTKKAVVNKLDISIINYAGGLRPAASCGVLRSSVRPPPGITGRPMPVYISVKLMCNI